MAGPPNLGRVARIGARLGRRVVEAVRDRVAQGPVSTDPGPFEVVFEGEGLTPSTQVDQVMAGRSLLEVALDLGIDLPHYCGGQCSCGTCRVDVLGGAEHLSHQDGVEQIVLGSVHVANGHRLACQARVHGPVRIRVPRWF